MGLDLEHARGIELLMALWEVKKSGVESGPGS
jgi:hypothetical protein